METKSKRDDMDIDRISELPEFLIHQILCYLPPKEAGRTTVLSKTWLQSFSSLPSLTFNERFFRKSAENVVVDPFFKFVNNTLSRYTSFNLRIRKLDITVSRDHACLIDKSLGVAFGNGVEELHIIFFATSRPSSLYTLPCSMFDSPKLLTYLSVEGCEFPENVVSNPKCHLIYFPFLRTLDLKFLYINDEMLQTLLSSSPSLEKIVLHYVSGLKKFRVCNLGKLKILGFITSIRGEGIEIDIEDATSLRFLKLLNSSNRPFLLKVGRALHNLKRLELFSVGITENSLKELITKFPLLELLEIKLCDGLERIKILSDSLKRLNLFYCKNLVEAEIDAPSLLGLEYFGITVLSLSLNNAPEELMTFIYIRLSGNGQVSDAWFPQLRLLLESVIRARVSVDFWLQVQDISFRFTVNLRENPLLPTEKYKPEMNPSSSFFAVFVSKLFSVYRPTSINSILINPDSINLMKFLRSELITATRNLNCCSSDQTKCWRHYLQDVKVEGYDDSQEMWQLLPPETSLLEFAFGKSKITFSLKWYANLNAHV